LQAGGYTVGEIRDGEKEAFLQSKDPVSNRISPPFWWAMIVALANILLLVQATQAQTYQVLYNFSGQHDGNYPVGGVTIDRSGNLYGTTEFGGSGYGGVYQLKPKNSAWLFNPLYNFAGAPDAFLSSAPVTVGPNGTLYGAAAGGLHDEGTIFNVTVSPTPCFTALCPWRERLLYSFNYTDGADLRSGIIFDQAGNIYGVATAGGNAGCGQGCGVVFELSRSGSSWTESYYAFTGTSDGGSPYGTVALGADGNLYGTTMNGGAYDNGTVFKLTPSGSGWIETTIHDFEPSSDGYGAYAGVTIDASGNLYGALAYGGPNSAGSVFELTPSNGAWTFTLLYTFPGQRGAGPFSNLVLANGSLYGTALGNGAFGMGSVFELTPADGQWNYTSLHDFSGGTDGQSPFGGVAFDANGDIYGTTSQGGTDSGCNLGCGLVWEITP
jgi:uncharacterized repeat protein (TIGR03803 family)